MHEGRHMASNACHFQAQVSLKQFLCSSRLKQASYTQLTVIFSTRQAYSPQAARPDKPASSFAEFLQTQAGKQQMAAGAGSVISLPLWDSLMGLSRYGRQLFVRPSYVQLKDRILQLHQAPGTYGAKMMIISGTPGDWQVVLCPVHGQLLDCTRHQGHT